MKTLHLSGLDFATAVITLGDPLKWIRMEGLDLFQVAKPTSSGHTVNDRQGKT